MRLNIYSRKPAAGLFEAAVQFIQFPEVIPLKDDLLVQDLFDLLLGGAGKGACLGILAAEDFQLKL